MMDNPTPNTIALVFPHFPDVNLSLPGGRRILRDRINNDPNIGKTRIFDLSRNDQLFVCVADQEYNYLAIKTRDTTPANFKQILNPRYHFDTGDVTASNLAQDLNIALYQGKLGQPMQRVSLLTNEM